MFSQDWPGGDDGIDEHGHASPNDMPSISVRVGGHTLPSPLIKTDQSVGMVMIGTDDAWVEGWERR